MTAHLAGAPVEELLLPLLSTGGALLLALRSALSASRSRRHSAAGSGTRDL